MKLSNLAAPCANLLYAADFQHFNFDMCCPLCNEWPGSKILDQISNTFIQNLFNLHFFWFVVLAVKYPAKVPRDGEFSLGKAYLVMDNEPGSLNRAHTLSGYTSAQKSLHKSRSQIQKTAKADHFSAKSRQNDLFKQHYCSLSTSRKVSTLSCNMKI